MKRIHVVMMFSAFAVYSMLCPSSLMEARPTRRITVRIDDVPNGAPVVTVLGAPDGWDLYTGPDIANPDIEDGGIITLFGVDQSGSINPDDGGWRFVDPSLPADEYYNATDIVWIQHDIYGDGDLQVAFNTREDGLHYVNPEYTTTDVSAGPATNKWVTVYSDSTITVQFRARTP